MSIAPSDSSASELPGLASLAQRIRESAPGSRCLGVLTVGVLPLRVSSSDDPGWSEYEAVLEQLSAVVDRFVRRAVRSADSVFGPGANGNGLVLLLDKPRGDGPLDASAIARARIRLRQAIGVALETAVPRETLERFGCFVGGALIRPSNGVPAERLLFRALEEAFADGLRERERHERHDLASLRRVLDGGRLRMVYQPVVDAVDCRVLGVEALARVSDGQFATPEVLFRKAREQDLLWRLERMCRVRALASLPPLRGGQLLFLNTEPDSLFDPELVDPRFAVRLDGAGLAPDRVVLEITEHAAVRDFVRIRAAIAAIRRLGFRVAMDDLGAGHSGLKAVAEIAPDFIKLDMALVREVHRHTLKRELIGTFRRFADSTGITLVAEGVESRDELDTLLELGVRCAQGYLFARPAETVVAPDWAAIYRRAPSAR